MCASAAARRWCANFPARTCFLEKLPPPHYDEARALLRERAADVDAFVAINRYYADFMADYLAVDRSRIHVIPHGLNLDGHASRSPPPGRI